MEREQRGTIDKCIVNLIDNVIPSDTLPHLPCLTDNDKEAIQRKEINEGPRSAVPVLLDRLKKRSGSYEQFLEALCHTGCAYLKDHIQQVSKLSQKESDKGTGKHGVAMKGQETVTKPHCLETEETTPPFKTQLSTPSEETAVCGFDILVCYGPTDKDVAHEMKAAMRKMYDLSVCIDEMDFTPGKAHSENICDFIHCSKTVVFLLSQDFLDKKWANYEMQHALFDALGIKASTARKKIIPIMLKKCDVPNPLKPYTLLDFQESRDWKRLASAVKENMGAGNTSGTSSGHPSTVQATEQENGAFDEACADI